MEQVLADRNLLAVILFLAVSGCSLAPELPSAERLSPSEAKAQDWPVLLPRDQLPLAREDVAGQNAQMQSETDQLAARAEALRKRADALAGDVLTTADKARLRQ